MPGSAAAGSMAAASAPAQAPLGGYPASSGTAPSSAASPAPEWVLRGTQAMTPAKLREMWANQFGRRSVIGFYGATGDRTGYGCFSNFFDQTDCPFDFVVPRGWFGFPVDERDRTVRCTFSEKSIMLVKAAMMGDRDSFKKIAKATTPAAAKKLGRLVRGFDDELWSRVVCTVALEVVHQKFSKTSSIREVLLGTGHKLLAEATRNDRNWGIGIDLGDERVQTPARWQGANILGWALMMAREALRCGTGDGAAADGAPGEATVPGECREAVVDGRSDETAAPSKCKGSVVQNQDAEEPSTKSRRWAKKGT